jgi:hypothetical protein
MNLHPLKSTLFMLIAALLLTGCLSNTSLRVGESRLESAVGNAELKTLAGSGIHVGLSPDCANEADARALAERDARSKIIQSIETSLKSSTIDSMLLHSEGELILSPDIYTQSRLSALAKNVIAVHPHSYYIERRQHGTTGGLRTAFVVYCRMDYSREQHLALLGEHIEQVQTLAVGSFDGMQTARQAGNWGQALRQAKHIARAVGNLQSTYSGFSPKQNRELTQLNQQVLDWYASIRLTLVMEGEAKGHEFLQALRRELGSGLKSRTPLRFQQSARNCDLTLLCFVDLSSRRVMAGLMRATASVDLSLEDLKSGEILWRQSAELVATGSSERVAESNLIKQLTQANSPVEPWIRNLSLSFTSQ